MKPLPSTDYARLQEHQRVDHLLGEGAIARGAAEEVVDVEAFALGNFPAHCDGRCVSREIVVVRKEGLAESGPIACEAELLGQQDPIATADRKLDLRRSLGPKREFVGSTQYP